jgi:hypothetical protein
MTIYQDTMTRDKPISHISRVVQLTECKGRKVQNVSASNVEQHLSGIQAIRVIDFVSVQLSE